MKKIYIVDDFLTEKELKEVSNFALTLSYGPVANKMAYFGNRAEVVINDKNKWIFEKIKNHFFPNENYKAHQNVYVYHMRANQNVKEINAHRDESEYNFLLYLYGEELVYNGTGFWTKQTKDGNLDLNTYIGFKRNRGIFFNGSDILHGDLQALGPSSPRYALTLFLDKEKN